MNDYDYVVEYLYSLRAQFVAAIANTDRAIDDIRRYFEIKKERKDEVK